MAGITSAYRGDGMMARVLRGAFMLMFGYGGSQALRLLGNLALTRILFPEAFGLMALVNVVTVGLSMFSDVGIGPSIAQNPRGDDRDFLNTAWTIQVIRGFCLWGGTLVLAWPLAQFYGEPALAWYLPISGVSLAIAGFNPTRIETAHRHLALERLTLLDLLSQFLGILAMVALALILKSVLALVLGGILQVVFRLILTSLFLPGERNRFRWEQAAAKELVRFGKWIFLSTTFWFVSSQGDRAILGKFLTLEMLGQYNIGFFLASFPTLLGQSVNDRLMIPVYREKPARESRSNLCKQRLLRDALTAGVVGLSLVMAYVGPWLVDVLYDPRYATAAPLVTLIACAMIPSVIGMTYDQAALAAGDSRSHFMYSAVRAMAQVVMILIGVATFGLLGAVVAIGFAYLAAYPALVWLARRHGVWDPLHDALALGLSMAIGGGAIVLHWDRIQTLL